MLGSFTASWSTSRGDWCWSLVPCYGTGPWQCDLLVEMTKSWSIRRRISLKMLVAPMLGDVAVGDAVSGIFFESFC